MALTEGERVLYARQLLLAELREPVHARVLAARAELSGAPSAAARDAFECYATRAGLGAQASAESPAIRIALPSETELAALAGPAARSPALAMLAGALSATRAVLSAAGIDPGVDVLRQLSVVSEDV